MNLPGMEGSGMKLAGSGDRRIRGKKDLGMEGTRDGCA